MTIAKKAPVGAKVLDLQSARTARAEARAGEPAAYLKLSVGFVEIKPEMDIFVIEDLKVGNVKSALTRLFADPKDAEAVFAEGITDDDFKSIVEFSAGKSLGEFSASTKL